MIFTAPLLFLLAETLIGLVLAFLSLSRVKSWFEQRLSAFAADRDHLRISLLEKLKTGQHRIVYGIFNKRTSQFVDGESVTAEEIDPEIAGYHDGTPVVIYS